MGPLLLIIAILGSIIFGIATPTEIAGIGAAGATVMASTSKRLTWKNFKEVWEETALTTAFLFGLIFVASCFSIVLRRYGGDELIENALHDLPRGANSTLVFILFLVFTRGFSLDWMEIVLIVAPLVLPVLSALGHEPAWVAILMAICLQTSFLTPPVGMALFYLKKSVPDVKITEVYRSVLPFFAIRVTILGLAFLLPVVVIW
jgi:TRAP-type mannitol/chloroaromatic compound transport system permease large subunit